MRPDEPGDALPVALALDLFDRRGKMQRTGPEHGDRQYGDQRGGHTGADQQIAAAGTGHLTPSVREGERKQHAGGHLDGGAEHDRAGAEPAAALEQQDDAGDHRHKHQEVVVASADSIDDDQRIEADERHRLDLIDAAKARPFHTSATIARLEMAAIALYASTLAGIDRGASR